MRHTTQVLLVIGACLCGAGCTSERAAARIGEMLELEECFLADPQAKMQDVWRTADGVLICSGKPLGYLYTKKDYRDFTLKLEWRSTRLKSRRASGTRTRSSPKAIR